MRRPPIPAPARLATLLLVILLPAILLAACADAPPAEPPDAADSLAVMDETARAYVDLVLELGTHDEGYVDAYYGPPERRDAAEAEPRSVAQIGTRAAELARRLNTLILPEGTEEIVELRRTFLARQLEAVAGRARMLQGEEISFDREARLLYDADPPHHDAAHFAAIIDEIDELVPGDAGPGDLVERYRRWRDDFVIPEERLDAVFTAAIEACRERTAAHLDLPPSEGFEVEYVRDKPWSGYNWYQGDYRSLIQVNVSLPIHVDRAIDLACHEGYPGHHVYNLLLEKHLARDRGWVEFTVYPLYSPQSLLAEGTANHGIEMAFPGDERVAFEGEVLFPLAGLDPERAETYYAVLEKLEELSYAGNEAARRYLDGEIDATEAAAWLERYALMPPERARQRVDFIDAYRAYVINYNLGQDMVAAWVAAEAGDGGEAARWDAFTRLLTTPRTPSGIAVGDGG